MLTALVITWHCSAQIG